MGEKDTSFIPRKDGNKFKARAMEGFMETCIRLQETNSDNSPIEVHHSIQSVTVTSELIVAPTHFDHRWSSSEKSY
jgi:hypothetical protein